MIRHPGRTQGLGAFHQHAHPTPRSHHRRQRLSPFIDQYSNTTLVEQSLAPAELAEPLPYQQDLGSDDEDEVTQPSYEALLEYRSLGGTVVEDVSDMNDVSSNVMQRERQEAERRAQTDAESRCDDAFEVLRAHRATLPNVETRFKATLDRWNEEDPDACQAFRRHGIHAAAYSNAQVRVFDIMRWWRKMPPYVSTGLEAMCQYFHQEASLDFTARHLEMRCGNVPVCSVVSGGPDEHWKDDQEYAACRQGKADYGWETSPHKNSFMRYVPRAEFKGRQAILHVRSGFEARKVRYKQALDVEKYGNVEFGKSLDKRLSFWVLEARNFLNGLGEQIFEGLTKTESEKLERERKCILKDMRKFVMGNAERGKVLWEQESAQRSARARCKEAGGGQRRSA